MVRPGFPKFDPHGDPIPDKFGNITHHKQLFLSELGLDQTAIIVGVKEHSSAFLKYLEQLNLVLGVPVTVRSIFEYDQSILIEINGEAKHTVTHKVAQNLYIKPS